MHESKMKTPEVERLYQAILTLRTPEECAAFFSDICTIHELTALSQRLEVAESLCRGETFSTIVEKTGASTATISRVNRCLKYGADGYAMVLSRLGPV